MSSDSPVAPWDAPRRVRKKRTPRRRSLVAPVLSAFLGTALIVLGVPRTIAAWETLAAQPTLEMLQVGKVKPSDAELSEAKTALDKAIAWVPSSRRYADLAFLEVEQLLRLAGTDPRRAALLTSAEQHLVESLVANPADGFSWFRIAVVRQLAEKPPRQIALALAQSLDVAPNVRQLWLPRATMLLSYWRYLTVDELLAFRAQLRTIWTLGKALRLPLLDAADRLGEAPMISWGIGADPQSQEEFEKLRANLPKLLPR